MTEMLLILEFCFLFYYFSFERFDFAENRLMSFANAALRQINCYINTGNNLWLLFAMVTSSMEKKKRVDTPEDPDLL